MKNKLIIEEPDTTMVTCIICGIQLPMYQALDPENNDNFYCGKCYVKEWF